MLHRLATVPPEVEELTPEESTDTSVHYVQSRFGVIKIDFSKALSFPQGLLGMHDKTLFALADFPNPKVTRFKVLQSLEDIELAFVVFPLIAENVACLTSFYEDSDLQLAAQEVGIPYENIAIILIASMDTQSEPARITVNMRAPLIIDTDSLQGAQYVFTNQDYPICLSI